ncbi:MAG: hypothetical protein BWY57_01115 [Betaproteobacteria bacterium ADurb.Bin341]|nr:MAG: hypothetical protein BWY57_01115 [Betaproteobacteria bacterium ADurb.Bin341]
MTASELSVLIFHTSNHAFRAEKLLKQADFVCKLVPVPRHLSSECGVCLRLETARVEAALEVLKAGRVDIDRVERLS